MKTKKVYQAGGFLPCHYHLVFKYYCYFYNALGSFDPPKNTSILTISIYLKKSDNALGSMQTRVLLQRRNAYTGIKGVTHTIKLHVIISAMYMYF